MIHQTLHALGFHNSAYEFWKDGNGDAHVEVTKKVATRGKSAWVLTTPNVVAQAALEFGYPELEYLELDVGGNVLVPGSNWEKRVMANDVMTRGFDVEGTIYSLITLKAM
jgi:hypothetical protein